MARNPEAIGRDQAHVAAGCAVAVKIDDRFIGSIDARPGLRAAEEKPSEVAGDFVKFVTNGEIEAGEAQAFDRAVQDVREQESA